jgi:uncharacterized protein
MSDQIDTLKQLQVIDGELYSLKKEKQQKPMLLEQAKNSLAEQQTKAKEIESNLKTTQLRQKEKEVELATKEGNVKKLQGQLFQLKTNKEYTTMQHEIELVKADISIAEEEIIKIFDSIDRLSTEHKAQLKEVEKSQGLLAQEEIKIAKELEKIQDRIGILEEQRKTITPLLKPQALSLYERILSSRDGMAIAALNKDSCAGCNMVQPPQVVNEVRLRAKLITCENCNRILFLEDEYATS